LQQIHSLADSSIQNWTRRREWVPKISVPVPSNQINWNRTSFNTTFELDPILPLQNRYWRGKNTLTFLTICLMYKINVFCYIGNINCFYFNEWALTFFS
jgi:hypothetical protein